ncbi:MAG: polysaccharide biosynthesis tyrosine autokinase [Vicingaceae bacterium]
MGENQNLLEDKIELAGFFRQLRSKWPWLIVFLILGASIGYIASKYKKPIYNAKASIKIDDGQSGVSDFLAIEMFEESFSTYNEVLTEAKILSSRSMIEKALKTLPLDVRYFKHGTLSSYELYRKTPIKLNVISNDEEIHPLQLNVSFENSSSFEVSTTTLEGEKIEKKASINEPFVIEGVTYSVVRNVGDMSRDIEKEGYYSLKVVDRSLLANEFASNLVVNQAAEKVSILNLSYRSSNPLLSKDFIEALVTTYVSDKLESKSKAASNAIRFIDERLSQLSEDMNQVEEKITEFKQENKILNFESVERLETDKLIDLESSKRLAEMRLLNLKIIEKELNQGKQISKISINAEGNIDPTLNQLITLFNQLKIEKATLAVNFTQDSKKSKQLDSKLVETINSIRESIELSKSSVKQEIEYLDNQIEILNRRYEVMPENQKDYFHLIRDFDVNQKVVSFLMEKKIEASIANASVVNDVRVIDLPILPREPISLSRTYIFAISLVISLFLGVSIIVLYVFFNNKIYDKSTLEKHLDIPVMGVLTQSQSKEFKSLEELFSDERTIFRESVNSLRTNLRFLPDSKDAKVISVTSTVSQEGKSFTLINLAASLTMLNKKVVVVDLDMRKPKIHNYFNDSISGSGSSLLLSDKVGLIDSIRSSQYPNLDYIVAGPVPPNPMELIQSDRFSEVLNELKEKYDYVMIDNPPIGIVSDAINVMNLSDVNLFVVRSGYSKFSFLDTAINVKNKNKIQNMYFILNGVKTSSLGYYSAYSQGYYTNTPKKRFV